MVRGFPSLKFRRSSENFSFEYLPKLVFFNFGSFGSFNNGFNSAFAGGDGQQLFSASHPTIGDGNQSNTLGATDLSEASLESALITISKAKDDRGILIGLQTQSLHIPSDLAFTADQILNSTMSTTIGVNPNTAANGATNVNDINSIRN